MNKYTFIIFSALLLCACQKTVVLKLNSVPTQIVIQGQVTNAPGPYTITINQSVPFYADNSFPPISGASVRISDDTGVTDSLTETTPGVYATHLLQGKPGHTYSLWVAVQDSIFTAVSTMPQPVSFDSLSFEQTNTFKHTQINAVANFQDPPGVKNYYQFTQSINGVPFTKNIFVFDDRLSDGRYINYNLRMDSIYIHAGDNVSVTMNCVDENIYNYFFQLDQSGSTGIVNTTASPANPQSNISNGAYGYFSANTTETKVGVAH